MEIGNEIEARWQQTTSTRRRSIPAQQEELSIQARASSDNSALNHLLGRDQLIRLREGECGKAKWVERVYRLSRRSCCLILNGSRSYGAIQVFDCGRWDDGGRGGGGHSEC